MAEAATETAPETAPETEQSSPAPVAAPPEPKAPEKKAAAGGAKAKDAKKGETGAKKPKGAKAEKAAAGDGPSVAAHPRAARAVARAKGWGGLLGFLAGGYMSLPTNTVVAAGVRALSAGLVCYVAVWAGAVFLWRRLVMLEIKGREQQLISAANARVRREPPAVAVEHSGAGAA